MALLRTGSEKYGGTRADTILDRCQYRCPCGLLSSCEIFVCVDTAEDSDIACRATEIGLERALNVQTCSGCGKARRLEVPFSYHNGSERVFVLVLPDSYRHRELEERAKLLLSLAEEGETLPEYVVNFPVAYGPEGLAAYLQGLGAENDARARDRERMKSLEDRVEEAASRDEKLSERERALARETAELDRRSSSLTEREIGLRDRKGALDRRSAELERKSAELEQVPEPVPAESQGEPPRSLRDEESDDLDPEDVLTSAPPPNASGLKTIPTNTTVSGTSTDEYPQAPENKTPTRERGDENAGAGPLAGKTRVAPAAGQRVGRPRAPSDSVTGRHVGALGDTDPDLGSYKTGPVGSSPQPPMTEVGDNDITVPSSPDQDIEHWRDARGKMLKILRGRDVRLICSVHQSSLGELMAGDIRALLQLHRMPSYPLVSLTLARATTLAGQVGRPFSFHFDVGESADRAVLEQLAVDFRFKLEIYDADYKPIRQRRLAAPLSANIRYVLTLATDARKNIAPHARSFEQAISAFNNPRHDRLGRGHRLAREFKDSLLDKLTDPADLLSAIAQCESFSEAAGEEYLVAIRSYPFDRWHRRRLEVIRKALDIGLWMGPNLARVAVSEEMVRSRKELVMSCQQNFSRYIAEGAAGLSDAGIESNFAALDGEAESLGIAAAAVQSSAEDSVASGVIRRRAAQAMPRRSEESDQQLLAQLDEPTRRLEAVVELCQRKTLTGMDPLFRALAELPPDEAPEAFAAIASLGNQAAESLLVLLSCPSAHLRQGAALALCELHHDEGVDSICEALMTDEGTLWREYAYALGRVGSGAIMPLVARIRPRDKRGQARAVWALGYIAAGGVRKPIATLASGRDVNVAQAANAALELERRLRERTVPVERKRHEKAFSTKFYQSLPGASALSLGPEHTGPAMVLDEGDLMEAID